MNQPASSSHMKQPLLDVAGDDFAKEPTGTAGRRCRRRRCCSSWPCSKSSSEPITVIGNVTLACLYLPLPVQWVLITMSTAFFPDSPVGVGISDLWQGVIFSAFPLGAAVASRLVSLAFARTSKRATLLFGLVCMTVFIVAFGLVPFVIPGAVAAPATMAGSEEDDGSGNDTLGLWWSGASVLPPPAPASASTGTVAAFVVVALLYGFGSTFATIGAYTTISQVGLERGKVGVLVSVAEMLFGVGAMLGPPFGGGLYTLGGHLGVGGGGGGSGSDPRWLFLFPFLCAAALPTTALALTLALARFPETPPLPPPLLLPSPSDDGDNNGYRGVQQQQQQQEQEKREQQEMEKKKKPKLTLWRLLAFCSLALTSMTYTAYNPTLEIRLNFLGVAANALSATTGLYFLVSTTSCVFYVFHPPTHPIHPLDPSLPPFHCR
jgi:MFS family permease